MTAHEIAHQWWGHQVVSSSQLGGTFIIESLSQYSALLVMEKLYGPEHIRRFLKYELDRYLRSRGGEVLEELPLSRVENQAYIHYQKGSLALEFDVGVFTAEPGKRGYAASDVLRMERQRIRSGSQAVTLVVDRKPAFVGVDPYNKRIDRNSDDNVVAVGS